MRVCVVCFGFNDGFGVSVTLFMCGLAPRCAIVRGSQEGAVLVDVIALVVVFVVVLVLVLGSR